MKDSDVAVRLNKLNNSDFSCGCGLKHRLPIEFIGGNYLSGIKSVVQTYAPYGRIAFIAEEATFSEFGNPILAAVKSVGCKMTSVVTSAPEKDTIDNISGLFNLPEDTRLVIVFDSKLFNSAAYFATVRNVRLVVIPLSADLSFALSVAACFRNGKNTDRVALTAERSVIFDENIIDSDTVPQTYAHIMSKLTALADYRLYAAVYNIEPCRYAYGLAKKAILSAFGIIKTNPLDIPLVLAEASACLGLANAVTGGAIYDFAAAGIVARLYGSENSETELYMSAKIISVYDICFNGDFGKITAVSDYNARAEFFADVYGFPENQLSKNFIAQIRAIRHGEKKLNAVIKSLKREISANVLLAENILKIYNALGGVEPEFDEQKLKSSIKHGGDTPYFLNGLSVVRSKGMLEYIV